MNIVYFVPLTWPLNGMEFDIGGGVDNGVTTSGKEVQEALVNIRLHGWAGSVREASGVTASPGRRRPSSGARGRSITDTPDGAVPEQPRHTHPGLEPLVTPSLSQPLNSLHPLCRREGPCCLQRPTLLQAPFQPLTPGNKWEFSLQSWEMSQLGQVALEKGPLRQGVMLSTVETWVCAG